MDWKFWEKEKEEEVQEIKPEIKAGSFLFATNKNDLDIISIEIAYRRDGGSYTEVCFRQDGKLALNNSNATFTYDLSYEQHEDFVAKMAKEISCIVVPPDPLYGLAK